MGKSSGSVVDWEDKMKEYRRGKNKTDTKTETADGKKIPKSPNIRGSGMRAMVIKMKVDVRLSKCFFWFFPFPLVSVSRA